MFDNEDEQAAAPYYDCSIRAGFYNLGGVDLAHHTYAIAEKSGRLFAMPCFGSFAMHEGERGNTGVRFPADLWSATILFPRFLGTALPANLSVALGMAQFTLLPAYDWTNGDWDDYWRRNPSLNGLSPSCWAGLVYAITGVCHQACNRILWSSLQGGFLFGPVNWPPSLSASYWVYGFHGKAADAAMILASALVVKALLGDRADEGELQKAHALARNVMQHHVAHALRDPTRGEARAHEVRGILDHLPEALRLSDQTAAAEIVNLDRAFSDRKNLIDNRLYRTGNDAFHDEYAGQVNDDFRTLLNRFREIMPADTFRHLFPDAADHRNYTLVDRRLMPQDYLRHREGHNP